MTRSCGDCQLCCRLLVISELGKPAGARCGNQKFGVGCKVHGTAGQPRSCSSWACWWLLDKNLGLPRPDRAGYVIDTLTDFIVLGEDVFAGKRVPALQVWADPSRRDAWRAALPWIKARIGAEERAAIIRFGTVDSIVLLPPQLSHSGDWTETDTRMLKPVTAAQLREKMYEEAVREQKV